MNKLISTLVVLGYITLLTKSSPSVRNPLSETVNYLHDEERKIYGDQISLEQTQILLDNIWGRAGCSSAIDPALCNGCLQANELFYIVEANISTGLQEKDFERASVVILNLLQNGVCKLPREASANYSYVDHLFDVITTQAPSTTLIGVPNDIQTFYTLPADLSFSEDQLHYILELIKDRYTPKKINKCFTSRDIFDDIGRKYAEKANEYDVERLCSVVIANLLRGECIGHSKTLHPNFFVESIFENYGTFGTILEHDFELLLDDLGIGNGHEGHPHDSYDSRSWRENADQVEPESNRRKRRENSVIKDQKSRRRKRAFAATVEPFYAGVTEAHHDHDHDGDQHDEHDEHGHCYSYHDLLSIYEIRDDVGSEATFNTICPALVEQIVSQACDGPHAKRVVDQSAEVYGWATLAVFLVTLCSMIGIIIVPLASVKIYTGIMHLFVALAVSTLSGDALLHLIPEALGLHGHTDHQHHAEQAASPEEVLSKVLVVVAAIYAFFLFERVMMVCLGKNPHQEDQESKTDKLGECASSPEEYTPAMFQAGNTIEMDEIADEMPQFSDIDHIDRYSTPATEHPPPAKPSEEEEVINDCGVDFENIPINAQYQSHELTDTLFVERKKKELSTRTSFSFTKGMQSISIMVLVADAVHNTTDGIAIGVAFTLDIYVGISTCLAVFCHELPHEIGDFAVLLKNGLGFRTAFFWSLMSNMCGFFGVYIGIALGSNETLHQWIFAATAGMFLYIALVDLMPEITHDPSGLFSNSVFLMHNIGLLAGWTLMVLLAYFERFMGGELSSEGEPIPV